MNGVFTMTGLMLSVLGELRLIRTGQPVPLPASRKTRALLAYLALTGRPHRRERLCELFWELPDDPRASLRWALSKIRAAVDMPGDSLILADRERVALAPGVARSDYADIRAALDDPDLPRATLADMAAALAEPLLDGLDLPRLDGYQSWLRAEREEAARLHRRVLARLAEDADADPQDAARWARVWVEADPLAGGAAQALAAALRRSGRGAEAEAAERAFLSLAAEAGIDGAAALDPGGPVPARRDPEAAPRALMRHQAIGFCTAADGVRIAYATVGDGPPIVKAANWLNHLELDWQSPIWGRTFAALADGHRLIRYDERGNGLSDWDVAELSFPAFVTDLETVVDSLGIRRFPLFGMSQGCAVSIAYAVRHPDRVSCLILLGGYAAGWRIGASAEERERREAVMTLTRLGWGTNNPAYRHIFSQTFMPDGTPEELAWFDEFQRLTTSAENAVRFQDAFGDIDVRALLAEVRVPTLVLHAQGDQRIAFEQGRALAAGIAGARFVALDSRSHILLGHEPAWEVGMAEIRRFLGEHAGG